MKFILLDRIIALEPGSRIVASKSLTLAEEYLGDHFPTFPVMPGVLMLEGMVQAASWLVRVTEGFSHSMIVLEEARNISYKSFVTPGRTLDVTVDAIRIEDGGSEFKAVGRCGGDEVVKARLKLRHYNLAERNKGLADTDRRLVSDARRRFELLGGPLALEMAAALVDVT
ncbi:MAG: beta-hydroxyacyl-ACP dehydratase [Phycisphaerae bacterium]|nr:beta-hydroxyacyl-ACP dehydratase [Phycisphaerae bacterium]